MIDAAILSNRIITPNGVKKAVVLIEQGKIAAITNELPQGIALAIGIFLGKLLFSASAKTVSATFEEKINAAKGKLHTNCGFWGGIIPGNEKEIEPLIEKARLNDTVGQGVLGFKAFLTHSGIDEFPNVTEKDLRKVMPLIAKQGLPLLVHCEMSGDEVPKVYSRSFQTRVSIRH